VTLALLCITLGVVVVAGREQSGDVTVQAELDDSTSVEALASNRNGGLDNRGQDKRADKEGRGRKTLRVSASPDSTTTSPSSIVAPAETADTDTTTSESTDTTAESTAESTDPSTSRTTAPATETSAETSTNGSDSPTDAGAEVAVYATSGTPTTGPSTTRAEATTTGPASNKAQATQAPSTVEKQTNPTSKATTAGQSEGAGQTTTTAAATTTTTAPTTTTTSTVPTTPATNRTRTAGGPQPGANFSDWNVPVSQQARALDLLAEAGMTWLRVDVGWRSYEQTCDDCYSSWYIDRIDALLAKADARGLEVMFTVSGTPDWANSGDKLAPPDNPAKFEEFMTWLARRYRGRVIGYEIGNEPDIDMFFHGDVHDYVELLQAAYRGVKAGDPNGTVVFAGTTHQNAKYIADAYAAGAGGYFDVMATHPYQGGSDKPPDHPTDGNYWWMTEQTTVNDVLRRHGDGHKEVWWTEFAWSVNPNHSGLPSYRRGVTEQQQGEYLVGALELAAQRYPNVTRVAWYNTLERIDAGASYWTRGYALIRRDMTPRPALEALRRYTGGG
jgi:hypothetical protein